MWAFLLELGDRGIDPIVQPPILVLAARQIVNVEKWLEFREDARRQEVERQKQEEESRRAVEKEAAEACRAAEIEQERLQW
jgi:hypothetical protein